MAAEGPSPSKRRRRPWRRPPADAGRRGSGPGGAHRAESPRHGQDAEAVRTPGIVRARYPENGRQLRPAGHGGASEARIDFRDSQGQCAPERKHVRPGHPGNPAGRLRVPAFALLQLPAVPGGYLCLALADPAVRPPHRRPGGRRNPGSEGQGTFLCPAQGGHCSGRGICSPSRWCPGPGSSRCAR